MTSLVRNAGLRVITAALFIATPWAATAGNVANANAASATGATVGGAPLTSVATLADGTDALIGRQVHLSNVTIDQTNHNGFMLRSGNTRLFVVPALPPPSPITPGNTVTIDGVVMDMPQQMIDQLAGSAVNTNIYVYALGVRQ